MKLRSMIFGEDYRTQRSIPGFNGKQTEIYVGQELRGIHGRPPGTVTSLELDRQAGMVMVRAIDSEGKPYRCWTNNQTPREHEYGDFIGVPLEGSTVRFIDDDATPKAQPQPQHQQGRPQGK